MIHGDLSYKNDELGDDEISFKDKIDLKNIFFEYEKDKPVLNNLTLSIKKGEKVAFIWESGSGKSTVVDLIVGLYIDVFYR